MGLRDSWETFKRAAAAEILQPAPPTRAVERLARPLTVEDVIAASISAREAEFSLLDALRMPPVIRAKTLLCTTAASLPATRYGPDGYPTAEQPRIVTRPNAYKSRADFVSETMSALVDYGEAFWYLGDYDAEGRPQVAWVLPNHSVRVEWNPDLGGMLPMYHYREQKLTDREIKHIAIMRRPGELHGRGPLTEALPYLAAIDAAERYASAWYGTSGIPSVVLNHKPARLTDEQSADLLQKWMNAHLDGVPRPAVVSGGTEIEVPNANPQASQLQEARTYGATVVARLLGIPGPMLLIETSGSTVTYQNVTAFMSEFVKVTLAPTYLTPIEAAWSDLVGGRARVRFELGELQRADPAARVAVYKELAALGVITAEQIASFEGISSAPMVPVALRPTPQPAPMPTSVPPSLESLGMVSA